MKKVKLMKNEKNNIFWIFFRKIWKNVGEKLTMMKMGQILMKKVKIDEHCKKKYFFDFFSEEYGKMSTKVKNDENGSDIDKKGQN